MVGMRRALALDPLGAGALGPVLVAPGNLAHNPGTDWMGPRFFTTPGGLRAVDTGIPGSVYPLTLGQWLWLMAVGARPLVQTFCFKTPCQHYLHQQLPG